MDMKKDCMIPYCGNLPEGKGRLVVGAKQLRKAVLAGQATRVYFARNADPALLAPLERLCEEKNISVTWAATMADLGRKCGIEVGAAAAAEIRR